MAPAINALILIDIQKGFLNIPHWGKRGNINFETNTKRLLEIYRRYQLPVIHIQHLSTENLSPLRPGQPGAEFLEGFEPRLGERIFQKIVNSSFIGTNLETYLKVQGINSLTLVGLTADHCVSTTARMGSNLGFQIFIVSECTATFDRSRSGTNFPADLVQSVSLASLNGEFATVFDSVSEFESLLPSNLF
jgi:nicotinamidase-related amidase